MTTTTEDGNAASSVSGAVVGATSSAASAAESGESAAGYVLLFHDLAWLMIVPPLLPFLLVLPRLSLRLPPELLLVLPP
jgi:hypothetical protein